MLLDAEIKGGCAVGDRRCGRTGSMSAQDSDQKQDGEGGFHAAGRGLGVSVAEGGGDFPWLQTSLRTGFTFFSRDACGGASFRVAGAWSGRVHAGRMERRCPCGRRRRMVQMAESAE